MSRRLLGCGALRAGRGGGEKHLQGRRLDLCTQPGFVMIRLEPLPSPTLGPACCPSGFLAPPLLCRHAACAGWSPRPLGRAGMLRREEGAQPGLPRQRGRGSPVGCGQLAELTDLPGNGASQQPGHTAGPPCLFLAGRGDGNIYLSCGVWHQPHQAPSGRPSSESRAPQRAQRSRRGRGCGASSPGRAWASGHPGRRGWAGPPGLACGCLPARPHQLVLSQAWSLSGARPPPRPCPHVFIVRCMLLTVFTHVLVCRGRGGVDPARAMVVSHRHD